MGKFVLVGSDNKKGLEWPVGRVVKVFPCEGGQIRLAKVDPEMLALFGTTTIFIGVASLLQLL